MPQPSRDRFTEDSDELVIEDETERVSLTGNIQVGTCVTGILAITHSHRFPSSIIPEFSQTIDH